MLFTRNNTLNAIGLPYNWNADYANGKQYSEYDLLNHTKNDFYLIRKNQVLRFGLFGQGRKLFFEMSDGSFNINGKRVEIEYHADNGEIYYLTTNFQDKDLITYKEAFTDFNGRDGFQRSNLKSINFGYKTIYTKDGTKFFFQPIVSLSVYSSEFIEIKLSSNKTLNGYLVFKTRGNEIERFDAPLEDNVSWQINWTIK